MVSPSRFSIFNAAAQWGEGVARLLILCALVLWILVAVAFVAVSLINSWPVSGYVALHAAALAAAYTLLAPRRNH